jgi:hypothetical protein
MFSWSLWDFFWILCAGVVAGFGWAGGNRLFGRLLG